MSEATRMGALPRSTDLFEDLARIDHLVIDNTGTMTEKQIAVVGTRQSKSAIYLTNLTCHRKPWPATCEIGTSPVISRQGDRSLDKGRATYCPVFVDLFGPGQNSRHLENPLRVSRVG